MRTIRLSALLLSGLLLSGCGLLKQKAAEHYLDKARAAAAAAAPTPALLEAGFAAAGKAIGYAPGSEQAVNVLEDLAAASEKAGFARGQELQAGALRKALSLDPLNWYAAESLINFYAARGDVPGLEAMAAHARGLAASGDGSVKYRAALAELAAGASELPWLESAAYLALNKTPGDFFDRLAAYASLAGRLPGLKAAADRLAASDPAARRAAPPALASAAEVAAADALRPQEEIRRALDFAAKASSEPAFRKAAEMTVLGNAALVRREYAQARAYYQGAAQNYPGLLDARRQLAETDFQEGAALAASGGDPKEAARLLYRAYAGAGEAIKGALAGGERLPFVKSDRFLGELYSLKAADLAALRAVEGGKLRGGARLEAEFKSALDEAVRLNPEGRLARELLERYSKDGF